jgi:glycosyltransferase involved in cell wall biosynthesis
VTSGEHLMLADDPVSFARDVVRLIRDDSKRERLGRTARSLVLDRYDWSAVAGSMEDALERIAAGRADDERMIPFAARVAPANARVSGRLS